MYLNPTKTLYVPAHLHVLTIYEDNKDSGPLGTFALLAQDECDILKQFRETYDGLDGEALDEIESRLKPGASLIEELGDLVLHIGYNIMKTPALAF